MATRDKTGTERSPQFTPPIDPASDPPDSATFVDPHAGGDPTPLHHPKVEPLDPAQTVTPHKHVDDEVRPPVHPKLDGQSLTDVLLRELGEVDRALEKFGKQVRTQIGQHIETVIGEDLRRLIGPGSAPDPQYVRQLSWPWLPGYFNRSCRLTISFPDGPSYGTGFFISTRAVLTAAHCLYDRNRQVGASQVKIQPGFSNLYQESVLPSITVPAGALRIPDEYKDPEGMDWEHDYAVLLLDRPLDVAVFPLAALSELELADAQVLVVGYPTDKKRGMEQFVGKGCVTKVQAHYILHTVDTEAGQSGSGIFLLRGSRPEAVGIHCGNFDSQYNRGTRLTPEILAQIQSWLTEPCTD